MPPAPTLNCGGIGPVEECDYQPYCFNASADDPDDVLLAIPDLFAYYKMDDASGLIQDSSGNGNHATSSSGTISYAEAALTAKVGNSIEFDGGHFVIPKPGGISDMVTDGAAWTMIWLEQITAYAGAGSSGNPRILMGQSGSGAAALLFGTVPSLGAELYTVTSNRAVISDEDLLPITQTFAVMISKKADTSGASSVQYDTNGVQWLTAGAVTTGNNNLTVGRSDDGFWGWSTHRMSNLATFTRVITFAEHQSILESLLTATELGTGVVPA